MEHLDWPGGRGIAGARAGTPRGMVVALELLGAFVLIVFGALVFTNAVEWLGNRLDLGAGAVGALLAAVGTALPESVIPVVALLSGGGEEKVEIAIGAIIGAPFMLATVAMLLVTASALAFRGRRDHGPRVVIEPAATRRDLVFFLALFPVGIALGAIGLPLGWRIAGAVVLVGGYAAYVRRTVRRTGGAEDDEEDLDALTFDPSKQDPPTNFQIAAQFVVSLAAIVGGAELFVSAIESIAESLGIPLLVLALVLAPLATELPEKANSVLWMRDGKDQLALGNITGAMTFQASIPVAFGLLATSWTLDRFAIAAACIGLAGAALSLWVIPRGGGLAPSAAWAALFTGFVVYVAFA
jgi:cation:H+ antiporter